jgi:hypothetical protein
LLGQGKIFLYGFCGLWEIKKHSINSPINLEALIPLDRGGVPDLSVSGDKSDLVVVDPHDPTTTSETRSANAIAEPTPDGY